MIDDRKHTEQVKVMLTERELVDLCRLATAEDRKPAELIRVVLRSFMYGRLRSEPSQDQENARSASGTKGAE